MSEHPNVFLHPDAARLPRDWWGGRLGRLEVGLLAGAFAAACGAGLAYAMSRGAGSRPEEAHQLMLGMGGVMGVVVGAWAILTGQAYRAVFLPNLGCALLWVTFLGGFVGTLVHRGAGAWVGAVVMLHVAVVSGKESTLAKYGCMAWLMLPVIGIVLAILCPR